MQATQLLNLARELYEDYNCPLFLIGDLNSDRRSDKNTTRATPYEILSTYLTDTELTATEKIHCNAKTNAAYCVDHVFARGEARIMRYALLSESGLSPLSDHYPIFIDTML